MAEQIMLTTIDNPWDPFTQYDEWLQWDEGAGYHTNAYLARVVRTSDALSDADQEFAIDQAIEEIIQENVLGVYKKAVKTI